MAVLFFGLGCHGSRQAVDADLVRCFRLRTAMRSEGVVEFQVTGDGGCGFADRGIRRAGSLLVLDRFPDAFDEENVKLLGQLRKRLLAPDHGQG